MCVQSFYNLRPTLPYNLSLISWTIGLTWCIRITENCMIVSWQVTLDEAQHYSSGKRSVDRRMWLRQFSVCEFEMKLNFLID